MNDTNNKVIPIIKSQSNKLNTLRENLVITNEFAITSNFVPFYPRKLQSRINYEHPLFNTAYYIPNMYLFVEFSIVDIKSELLEELAELHDPQDSELLLSYITELDDINLIETILQLFESRSETIKQICNNGDLLLYHLILSALTYKASSQSSMFADVTLYNGAVYHKDQLKINSTLSYFRINQIIHASMDFNDIIFLLNKPTDTTDSVKCIFEYSIPKEMVCWHVYTFSNNKDMALINYPSFRVRNIIKKGDIYWFKLTYEVVDKRDSLYLNNLNFGTTEYLLKTQKVDQIKIDFENVSSHITGMLKWNRNIKILEYENIQHIREFESFSCVLRWYKNLSHIKLHTDNNELDGLNYIVGYVKQHKYIKGVDISKEIDRRQLYELLTSDYQTKKSIEIPSTFAFTYPQIFTLGKTLRLLNLNYNCLGAEGAKSLAELLLKTTVLKCLYLAGCYLGREGIISICESLKVNNTLTEINFKLNNIDDDSMIYISDMLKINSGLKQLGLHCNLIGDKGVSLLAEAFETNTGLIYIDLGQNLITDKGLKTIIKSLRDNFILREIYIYNNTFSEEAQVFADELRKENQRLLVDIGTRLF
jgi:hypothetical protein